MNEIKQNEVRWNSIIIPLCRFILRWKGNKQVQSGWEEKKRYILWNGMPFMSF